MSLHLFFTQEFKDKYKIIFLVLFFKFVFQKTKPTLLSDKYF